MGFLILVVAVAFLAAHFFSMTIYRRRERSGKKGAVALYILSLIGSFLLLCFIFLVLFFNFWFER
jgi:hypothetical protein